MFLETFHLGELAMNIKRLDLEDSTLVVKTESGEKQLLTSKPAMFLLLGGKLYLNRKSEDQAHEFSQDDPSVEASPLRKQPFSNLEFGAEAHLRRRDRRTAQDLKSVNEETQRLIELTRHSNPLLQDRIHNFLKLKQFNATTQWSEEHAHMNYLTQSYSQEVKAEQDRYRQLLQGKNQLLDGLLLERGSVINSCTLMADRPYL